MRRVWVQAKIQGMARSEVTSLVALRLQAGRGETGRKGKGAAQAKTARWEVTYLRLQAGGVGAGGVQCCGWGGVVYVHLEFGVAS